MNVCGKVSCGLVLLVTLVVPMDQARAQSVGLQFIGGSRGATPDNVASEIPALSNILVRAGGSLQVSLLPFHFNPRNPFGNMSDLIGAVTPSLNGRLRITVYLHWFPHTVAGNADQADFWAAWANPTPSPRQQTIRQNFMDRVSRTNEWVVSMRMWAVQNRLNGKLFFTTVPMLEDQAQNDGGYQRLLVALRQRQEQDGAITDIRRCSLPDAKYAFALSIPLELHGNWADVKGRLKSGDVWSNDGTEYSVANFVRDQKEALGRGVNVLAWTGSYNGNPQTDYNWASRSVNPFTGPNFRVERQNLSMILGSR